MLKELIEDDEFKENRAINKPLPPLGEGLGRGPEVGRLKS
jgi:hypothetical protein